MNHQHTVRLLTRHVNGQRLIEECTSPVREPARCSRSFGTFCTLATLRLDFIWITCVVDGDCGCPGWGPTLLLVLVKTTSGADRQKNSEAQWFGVVNHSHGACSDRGNRGAAPRLSHVTVLRRSAGHLHDFMYLTPSPILFASFFLRSFTDSLLLPLSLSQVG